MPVVMRVVWRVGLHTHKNAISCVDVRVGVAIIPDPTVSKCNLNIFPFILDYDKLTWTFDPLPVSRDIMRSLGWDKRSSSKLPALGNLISILSGCGFETAVTERSQVLLKIAHQFRTKLIM